MYALGIHEYVKVTFVKMTRQPIETFHRKYAPHVQHIYVYLC